MNVDCVTAGWWDKTTEARIMHEVKQNGPVTATMKVYILHLSDTYLTSI